MEDRPDQSDEEFWAENDPFGDRFAKKVPWWGCLAAAAVLVLVAYGLYRLAIWLGLSWSVSV